MGLMSDEQEAPGDVDLLKLLLDTTSSRNDDEATARQEYMRIRLEVGAELPDFDQALARGWFRLIQGRVVPAVALRDYYLRRDVPYAEALRSFVYWLSDVKYQIAQPGAHVSASTFEDYLVRNVSTLSQHSLRDFYVTTSGSPVSTGVGTMVSAPEVASSCEACMARSGLMCTAAGGRATVGAPLT